MYKEWVVMCVFYQYKWWCIVRVKANRWWFWRPKVTSVKKEWRGDPGGNAVNIKARPTTQVHWWYREIKFKEVHLLPREGRWWLKSYHLIIIKTSDKSYMSYTVCRMCKTFAAPKALSLCLLYICLPLVTFEPIMCGRWCVSVWQTLAMRSKIVT